MISSKFSYPPDIIIKDGPGERTLTEREVLSARPFRIGDIWYTDPTGRQDIGIKVFEVDAVPVGYISGSPVDTETVDKIHRTFPNATFNYSGVKQDYLRAINEKRKAKEEHGFIFDSTNLFISTDVKGSLRMTQMAFVFQADPTHVAQWKGTNPTTGADVWFAMDAVVYSQIVAEGQQYVRDCFLRQQALQEELEALQETPEAYLAFANTIETGWPA